MRVLDLLWWFFDLDKQTRDIGKHHHSGSTTQDKMNPTIIDPEELELQHFDEVEDFFDH